MRLKLTLSISCIVVVVFLYFLHTNLLYYLKQLIGKQIQPNLAYPSPLTMLQEHLLYLSVYGVGAWFFFYKLLPKPCTKIPFYKPGSTNKKSLFSGLVAGILVFLVILLSVYFFSENSGTIMYRKSKPHISLLNLVWQLFFTALLTGTLEEVFYRGFLQNYLEKNLGSWFAIVISTIAFAMVHPGVRLAMILPAFTFSILFWKQGLFSAIVAHISYNSLILLATAKIYVLSS